jgi:hypothetical protein
VVVKEGNAMKNLKEFTLVIGLLLVVTALVILRVSNKSRFSGTTQNIVETLKNEPVFIRSENLQFSDYLVVELGENSNVAKFPSSIKVSFEGLTDNNFRKQLITSEKKILLTGEESQAAKAWVILNQLGVENLFILSEKENPEALRYTFIPDTTSSADVAE